MELTTTTNRPLSPSHILDLRLAASKISGIKRRAFQAAMSLKYCQGSPRLTESVFGWGRTNVALGLAEHRSGFTCVGAQSLYGGAKRWEEHQPAAATALRQLAEAKTQQDPTFRTAIGYTRLTASEALRQLRTQGFSDEQLPSASTMSEVLNRMGYRLRKVVKAKPQKNSPKPTLSLQTSKPKMLGVKPNRANA